MKSNRSIGHSVSIVNRLSIVVYIANVRETGQVVNKLSIDNEFTISTILPIGQFDFVICKCRQCIYKADRFSDCMNFGYICPNTKPLYCQGNIKMLSRYLNKWLIVVNGVDPDHSCIRTQQTYPPIVWTLYKVMIVHNTTMQVAKCMAIGPYTSESRPTGSHPCPWVPSGTGPNT